MSEFKKYQHVERLGSSEVEGIELGTCVIMPKIDGTNASIWVKDEGGLGFGSRTRELSLEKDNADFMKTMINDERIINYFKKHPSHRLYGEWLVPHTIKGYKHDAWKKFYVFDVTVDDYDTIEYIPYDVYKPMLEEFGIDYIEPLAIIHNPTKESLYDWIDKNDFLMQDGLGEGIVIHNYGFYNQYGRQVWAKIVRDEFKNNAKSKIKQEGYGSFKNDPVEIKIVDEFVTSALIEKEYAKIVNEEHGWSSKFIPRLLNVIYYSLINEEMWNIIKKYKNPKIDFKFLQTITYNRVKIVKHELFA